jgi:hypothetical protein
MHSVRTRAVLVVLVPGQRWKKAQYRMKDFWKQAGGLMAGLELGSILGHWPWRAGGPLMFSVADFGMVLGFWIVQPVSWV